MNFIKKCGKMSKKEFIKKKWPKNSAEQKFKEFLIAGEILNKLCVEIIKKESVGK